MASLEELGPWRGPATASGPVSALENRGDTFWLIPSSVSVSVSHWLILVCCLEPGSLGDVVTGNFSQMEAQEEGSVRVWVSREIESEMETGMQGFYRGGSWGQLLWKAREGKGLWRGGGELWCSLSGDLSPPYGHFWVKYPFRIAERELSWEEGVVALGTYSLRLRESLPGGTPSNQGSNSFLPEGESRQLTTGSTTDREQMWKQCPHIVYFLKSYIAEMSEVKVQLFSLNTIYCLDISMSQRRALPTLKKIYFYIYIYLFIYI